MKNTSVALGEHWGRFVAALVQGEESGLSDRSPENIRAAVRRDLGLDGGL